MTRLVMRHRERPLHLWLVLLCLLFMVPACGGGNSASPPPEPAGPVEVVATPLPTLDAWQLDPESPPSQPYLITVDEEPIWPPEGPECRELRACCDPLWHDTTVMLGCQMAVLYGSCHEARRAVADIVQRLELDAPDACAPPPQARTGELTP